MSKILYDLYYHKDSRKLATEIVREFIISKRLIITGGLVVDFALRLKGQKIYEDYVVPDYDFFSTQNVRDACELFNLLRKSGLTNISLVTGIHPTTVKVFVYKDCVADITFAYESLFKDMKKSALTYDGMLFRNPEIQYVDMHRALTYPYENEPRETINNRWIKDFERFCLLYALTNPEPISMDFTQPNMDHIAQDNNYVHAGLYAIKFYLERYKIAKVDAVDHVYLMNDSDRNAFLIKNGGKIRNQQQFKAFGELLPARTEMTVSGVKYTILHCLNKTAVYDAGKTTIVSVNFCIIYCFSMYRITGDEKYNTYYHMLLGLVYNAYKVGNTDLYPSIITYGDELENPVVKFMSEHPELRMTQVHISADNSPEENEEEIAKLPWDFKYDESVFVLDGSAIKN